MAVSGLQVLACQKAKYATVDIYHFMAVALSFVPWVIANFRLAKVWHDVALHIVACVACHEQLLESSGSTGQSGFQMVCDAI